MCQCFVGRRVRNIKDNEMGAPLEISQSFDQNMKEIIG